MDLEQQNPSTLWGDKSYFFSIDFEQQNFKPVFGLLCITFCPF